MDFRNFELQKTVYIDNSDRLVAGLIETSDNFLADFLYDFWHGTTCDREKTDLWEKICRDTLS